MNLRYSANIMKFEDGMKKVSAIAWAPTGKKLAIASADKVSYFIIYSLSTSLMMLERKKISSLQNPQTRVRNLI